jgi:hypothetical protein
MSLTAHFVRAAGEVCCLLHSSFVVNHKDVHVVTFCRSDTYSFAITIVIIVIVSLSCFLYLCAHSCRRKYRSARQDRRATRRLQRLPALAGGLKQATLLRPGHTTQPRFLPDRPLPAGRPALGVAGARAPRGPAPLLPAPLQPPGGDRRERPRARLMCRSTRGPRGDARVRRGGRAARRPCAAGREKLAA